MMRLEQLSANPDDEEFEAVQRQLLELEMHRPTAQRTARLSTVLPLRPGNLPNAPVFCRLPGSAGEYRRSAGALTTQPKE